MGMFQVGSFEFNLLTTSVDGEPEFFEIFEA